VIRTFTFESLSHRRHGLFLHSLIACARGLTKSSTFSALSFLPTILRSFSYRIALEFSTSTFQYWSSAYIEPFTVAPCRSVAKDSVGGAQITFSIRPAACILPCRPLHFRATHASSATEQLRAPGRPGWPRCKGAQVSFQLTLHIVVSRFHITQVFTSYAQDG
jgi:hypothetical protein